MPKPKNFPEEMLDFAQSYLASAISLLSNYEKDFPFTSINNYKKSFVLSSHFLMAHGVELYLKFLIKWLGGIPSTADHNLINLLSESNKLWTTHFKRKIFNKTEEKEINKLNKNIIFRYPVDKQLNVIPDMFNKASKWNKQKVQKLIKKWNKIREKLNDCGYRFTIKKNKGGI